MRIDTVIQSLAGLNAAFMQRYEKYEAPHKDAVLVVPSSSAQEKYGWLGDVPQMKKFKDEHVPKGLKEYNYSIVNEEFSSAFDISRKDMLDDIYGLYKIKVEELAELARTFPGELVSQLRASGHTGIAYDGLAFYSSSRPGAPNLVTGAGATVDNVRTDFAKARKAMLSMRTDAGNVLNRKNARYVIICSVDMELIIKEALMLDTLPGGGKNILAGYVTDIEVDGFLTGNSWYLEDRAPMVKAFIHQTRVPATPEHTGIDSDTSILRRAIVYTVTSYENVGYGLPFHSVKVVNT